jgi:hypothetical protein
MFARRLLGRRGTAHHPPACPGIGIGRAADEPARIDIASTEMTDDPASPADAAARGRPLQPDTAQSVVVEVAATDRVVQEERAVGRGECCSFDLPPLWGEVDLTHAQAIRPVHDTEPVSYSRLRYRLSPACSATTTRASPSPPKKPAHGAATLQAGTHGDRRVPPTGRIRADWLRDFTSLAP